MALSTRRALFAVAIFSAMPLLVACPKKETPVADAAPPPPEPETGTVVLAPLEEDAGLDAADAAEAAKKAGVAVPTYVARLRQCCGQLRTQAKALGASPEAGFLLSGAAQCDVLANQAAPGANAPELGILRTALAGRNIPPICAGF